MAVKAKLDSIDGLAPIDPKVIWKKDDKTGKFVLDVDSVDNLVLEDVSGLKGAYGATQAERDALKTKLATFGDLDPAAAREWKAKLDALGDLSKLTDAAKAEEALRSQGEQLGRKHKTELDGRDATIASLTTDLDQEMRVGRVQAAMVGKVKSPKAMLPLLLARTRIDVVDGKRRLRVLDEKGNPAITRKSGSQDEMGLDELVAVMGEDPELKPLYIGTGASGGGTNTPAPSGGGGGKPTLKVGDPSIGRNVEKIASGEIAVTD